MNWQELVWLGLGLVLGWSLRTLWQARAQAPEKRSYEPSTLGPRDMLATLGGAHAAGDLVAFDEGLRELSATTDQIEALQARYERQRAPDPDTPRAVRSTDDSGMDYRCRRLERDARALQARVEHLQSEIKPQLRAPGMHGQRDALELRRLLVQARELEQALGALVNRTWRVRITLSLEDPQAQSNRARQSLDKLTSEYRRAAHRLDALLAQHQRHGRQPPATGLPSSAARCLRLLSPVDTPASESPPAPGPAARTSIGPVAGTPRRPAPGSTSDPIPEA